jgi:hypothetical protein
MNRANAPRGDCLRVADFALILEGDNERADFERLPAKRNGWQDAREAFGFVVFAVPRGPRKVGSDFIPEGENLWDHSLDVLLRRRATAVLAMSDSSYDLDVITGRDGLPVERTGKQGHRHSIQSRHVSDSNKLETFFQAQPFLGNLVTPRRLSVQELKTIPETNESPTLVGRSLKDVPRNGNSIEAVQDG